MTDHDRQWDGQSRGGRFGNAFFVSLVGFFGLGAAYFILAFVVLYFIPFAPKATRAIWQYNRQHMKYGVLQSIMELYMHYYVFGQTLVDKIAIRSGMEKRFSFEFGNYERFLEIINSPGGVVLMGAHVGCWEAGTAFFGKYGCRINIVMMDAEKSSVKEVMEKHAKASDFKIINVNESPLEAVLKIKIALDQGEYVCFNGDRYLDRATTLKQTFLGGEALFPEGPFRIASKCRVPVVFYYAMREKGRRYRFIFTEAGLNKDGNKEKALLEQYVKSLEEVVRQYPRQWFNFYSFWK